MELDEQSFGVSLCDARILGRIEGTGHRQSKTAHFQYVVNTSEHTQTCFIYGCNRLFGCPERCDRLTKRMHYLEPTAAIIAIPVRPPIIHCAAETDKQDAPFAQRCCGSVRQHVANTPK
jgi:hypothetical protein